MLSTSPLHAWVDESMRSHGLSRPSYLLGGVLADPTRCGHDRERLRSLRTSGRKLHWREMDAAHRRRAISVISRFGIEHLIVVAAPLDESRQERARALCLERLCWELEQRRVGQMHLESRPPSLMARDLRTVERLRGRRAIGPGLRIDHCLPSEEPMVWAADLVLGALGDALAGRDEYMQLLGDRSCVVEIEL